MAKREYRELPQAPEPEKPAGKVFDLMAALEESVDKAKDTRGEYTGTEVQVHEMPAKKETAKAPAKKTARGPRRKEDGGEEGDVHEGRCPQTTP
ncbi:hypothetical protein [Streptomyces sp. NPDC054804]